MFWENVYIFFKIERIFYWSDKFVELFFNNDNFVHNNKKNLGKNNQISAKIVKILVNYAEIASFLGKN